MITAHLTAAVVLSVVFGIQPAIGYLILVMFLDWALEDDTE